MLPAVMPAAKPGNAVQAAGPVDGRVPFIDAAGTAAAAVEVLPDPDVALTRSRTAFVRSRG